MTLLIIFVSLQEMYQPLVCDRHAKYINMYVVPRKYLLYFLVILKHSLQNY